MSKKNLSIHQRVGSILKKGAFIILLLMVAFACNTAVDEKTTVNDGSIANQTFKTDGAILGNVIAPNAVVEIIALNAEEKIKGTTDENGAFFITGFDEGMYTVKITTSTSKKEEVFHDVTVKQGEVTALGTVDLAVQ